MNGLPKYTKTSHALVAHTVPESIGKMKNTRIVQNHTWSKQGYDAWIPAPTVVPLPKLPVSLRNPWSQQSEHLSHTLTKISSSFLAQYIVSIRAPSSGHLLDVCDVIPGVTIQWLFQPELIQVVANETNGPAEHKQAIQATKRHEIITFLT